jgi:2-oxoglutarate dehydrogenase E1 component
MKNMTTKWANSYLFGANADFMEELYDQYLTNPESLLPSYKKYFDSLQSKDGFVDIPQNPLKEKFVLITEKPRFSDSAALESEGAVSRAQAKVWALIDAYRNLGVEAANLDPLVRVKPYKPKALELKSYALEEEKDTEFYLNLDPKTSEKMKLKDIVALLDKVYCGTVSFEFEHIADISEREWLRSYVENKYQNYNLSNQDKTQLLHKLVEAEGLERYLSVKYPGAKRFSLEGGDSLIPLLDRILDEGAKHGVRDVQIGMAHRGRLNTLVNIAGKAPEKIFAEFDGNYKLGDFVLNGDVKYHKGYRCNYITNNGQVRLSLAYNPSHLEVVNPVINGKVRALQDKLKHNPESVLGILIHGDSALIGLGTNQGVLNMAGTRAYHIHGLLHIVVNNQVGFTTSDVRDTRTSRNCTDIAKMIEAPILHVNADDVESLAFIADFAIAYRSQFKKDIMINLVCFRRHGHQETDDPTLTQPLMYRLIKAHPGTKSIFAEKLIANGVITKAQVDAMTENYRVELNKGVHINAAKMPSLPWYDTFDIKPILLAKSEDRVDTRVSRKILEAITKAITDLPTPEFKLHNTVAKVVEARKLMGRGEKPIDFGAAESLAYGSLLNQGISIRITGEDSGRGTFSHRHGVWHDVNRSDLHDTGFIPLKRLENNSTLSLYDSVLNEECVLGFEYGYSTENLRDLVIWEAQFGDFANGAQVIIDQFIASAEAKWGTLSNLTMLLPHGYDGQGPEHSSARIERFLQLAAQNNMRLVIPSNAAQLFHLLRDKALTNWIKPLALFLSKRLLRLSEAMSTLDELIAGEFKLVIADTIAVPNEVKKVVVCSGQVYYDLVKARATNNEETKIALIRLEQLYPFPHTELKAELAKYKKADTFIWAQEEPKNQGAWHQLRDNLDSLTTKRFTVVARPESASPACGITSMHNDELKNILVEIFS